MRFTATAVVLGVASCAAFTSPPAALRRPCRTSLRAEEASASASASASAEPPAEQGEPMDDASAEAYFKGVTVRQQPRPPLLPSAHAPHLTPPHHQDALYLNPRGAQDAERLRLKAERLRLEAVKAEIEFQSAALDRKVLDAESRGLVEDAVMAANARFYEACGQKDYRTLRKLTAESFSGGAGVSVGVVQLGQTLRTGRTSVLRSWRNVFRAKRQPAVVLKKALVTAASDTLAVVVCEETLGAAGGKGATQELVSTNIWAWDLLDASWRLASRHSSLVMFDAGRKPPEKK